MDHREGSSRQRNSRRPVQSRGCRLQSGQGCADGLMRAGVKGITRWHPNALVMGEKVAKILAQPEKRA